MSFANILWEHIAPIYHQILQHPFNVELGNGNLERRRFIFYMEQDAHYLIGFSRALAFIAARVGSSEVMRHFLNFALGALIAERELHAHFLPSNYSSDHMEPSPACLGYTHYLIATAATATVEEAVAAILPCFWLYREVGRTISRSAEKNNPYALWIDTYASQAFSEGTDLAIALFNEIASRCSRQTLDLMKKSFEYCSLFEWHFWNDAYNLATLRHGKCAFDGEVGENVRLQSHYLRCLT